MRGHVVHWRTATVRPIGRHGRFRLRVDLDRTPDPSWWQFFAETVAAEQKRSKREWLIRAADTPSLKISVLGINPGDQRDVVRVLDRLVALTNEKADANRRAEEQTRRSKEREAARIQAEVAQREAAAEELTRSFRSYERVDPEALALADLRASGELGPVAESFDVFLETLTLDGDETPPTFVSLEEYRDLIEPKESDELGDWPDE